MIQKILKCLLPKDVFQKIEDESRRWFMECPQCGFHRSYWDAGGVRAFAEATRNRFSGVALNAGNSGFSS